MEQQSKLLKVLNIVGNAILYVFIFVSVFGVLLTIAAKKSEDGAATVFGIQLRYVLTASMEKSEYTNVDGYDIKDIPKNSLIFVEVVPEDDDEAKAWYDDLEVGDVLTFR